MTDSVDVLIIGGGVIGCAVAESLARRNRRVVLVDATLPGRATSASAGGLWAVGESIGLGCGVILHQQEAGGEDSSGPEPLPKIFMDFLLEGSRRFRELSELLRAETGVDIESESGTGLLYLLYDDTHLDHARQLEQWLDTEAALMETWSPEEVRAHDSSLTEELAGGVFFPGDNQVNPLLLAEALKRAAIGHGARFVANARVEAIQAHPSGGARVRAGQESWDADRVVVAAGAWSGGVAEMAGGHVPVFPVRGQIVCAESLSRTLRSNLSTPECYILQKAHGEIIIGSTTEHSGFGTQVRFSDLRRLAQGACRAVPGLNDVLVKRTWAGLRPGTPDEFPILGPDPQVEFLFYATGGFRTGIVAAPITAEMVAASVEGETCPFPIEPFLASRFSEMGDPLDRAGNLPETPLEEARPRARTPAR